MGHRREGRPVSEAEEGGFSLEVICLQIELSRNSAMVGPERLYMAQASVCRDVLTYSYSREKQADFHTSSNIIWQAKLCCTSHQLCCESRYEFYLHCKFLRGSRDLSLLFIQYFCTVSMTPIQLEMYYGLSKSQFKYHAGPL